MKGLSWPWSYGCWIYNYLCNQCLSPPMLWVWISIMARCTTLCRTVCQWLATDRWFSLGPPVSFTYKAERHNVTEILLKVALSTIKQINSKYMTAQIICFYRKLLWDPYNANKLTQPKTDEDVKSKTKAFLKQIYYMKKMKPPSGVVLDLTHVRWRLPFFFRFFKFYYFLVSFF